MGTDIYQLGDKFDNYTEAFEFLQRHLALVSLSDDDDPVLVWMAVEWVQAACEWCDQSGRGVRS